MSKLFKKYSTDKVKETEGAQVKLSDLQNEDGTYPIFYLARMGKSNKNYIKEINYLLDKHRTVDGEILVNDEDKSADELLDVFVKTILVNWENVKDLEDNNIPFSKEKAKELLKEMPDLYDRLNKEAARIENFSKELIESKIKN
jgi:hypothetical protein